MSYTVGIQIKENGKPWEDIKKSEQTFPEWSDVSTFAYRLSLLMQNEVRIENNGNGHYYHPTNAENFLDQ